MKSTSQIKNINRANNFITYQLDIFAINVQ